MKKVLSKEEREQLEEALRFEEEDWECWEGEGIWDALLVTGRPFTLHPREEEDRDAPAGGKAIMYRRTDWYGEEYKRGDDRHSLLDQCTIVDLGMEEPTYETMTLGEVIRYYVPEVFNFKDSDYYLKPEVVMELLMKPKHRGV